MTTCTGRKAIEIPKKRHKGDPKRTFHLEGATDNNLQNVSLDITAGQFICVTGVSGSGKSTLINDTLYRLLRANSTARRKTRLPSSDTAGLDLFDKVVDIDQSPIGRTPRSNPANYKQAV